ncbi:M15 family peptidase [Wohlfahrtiimonas chitiniclastica]|uniref:M15 family peptidase n=2 Tax=Wohlfahrtiimonas chitiniclastica TaxID=400946 RepID=UPI001BD15220|nr:M15 family peptidase [Wohlfahrtiimonas chitiniclastica]MBS7814768.1 M15 family peptidase [Wohlfahrtiimonas chitiniclastica]
MTFKLSNKSKSKLIGVHPDLVAVVNRAIELTTQDFTVFEGVRTINQQKENVKKGVSTTVNGSRHLIGKNGYAHAVDLVPYIDGQLRWDWDGCYAIAEAVRQASIELKIPVRWGGVCDKLLSDIQGMTTKQAQQAYVDQRIRNGQRAFAGGPHFELPLSPQYPQF